MVSISESTNFASTIGKERATKPTESQEIEPQARGKTSKKTREFSATKEEFFDKFCNAQERKSIKGKTRRILREQKKSIL